LKYAPRTFDGSVGNCGTPLDPDVLEQAITALYDHGSASTGVILEQFGRREDALQLVEPILASPTLSNRCKFHAELILRNCVKAQ
jgi:hypothetical protein